MLTKINQYLSIKSSNQHHTYLTLIFLILFVEHSPSSSSSTSSSTSTPIPTPTHATPSPLSPYQRTRLCGKRLPPRNGIRRILAPCAPGLVVRISHTDI